MAETGREGDERPEPLQRVLCGIKPGLVMKIRCGRLAAAQFFRPESALSSQYHSLVSGFNHHRLMAGRVAGRGKQTDPIGDVLVTMDETQPVLWDLRPVRNRVARRLRCLELGHLDIRGSGQSALLTTVVE